MAAIEWVRGVAGSIRDSTLISSAFGITPDKMASDVSGALRQSQFSWTG
jgi:hypothetical protein